MFPAGLASISQTIVSGPFFASSASGLSASTLTALAFHDSAMPNVTGSLQPLAAVPTRAASAAAGRAGVSAAGAAAAEEAGGAAGAVHTDSLLSQAARANTAAPRPA